MILLLVSLCVPLLLWVYYMTLRSALVPDADGEAVRAKGRLWHDKYGLPRSWALALARGSRVMDQSILCLAFALPLGALSIKFPHEDVYSWSFRALMFLAIVGLPLVGALVGFTGRPKSWLRSGSDTVSVEDL